MEGQCPAEFSSNPDQTHLSNRSNRPEQANQAKVFMITRNSQVGIWSRLELNSAGQWPSWTEFEKPCFKAKNIFWRKKQESPVLNHWLDLVSKVKEMERITW